MRYIGEMDVREGTLLEHIFRETMATRTLNPDYYTVGNGEISSIQRSVNFFISEIAGGAIIREIRPSNLQKITTCVLEFNLASPQIYRFEKNMLIATASNGCPDGGSLVIETRIRHEQSIQRYRNGRDLTFRP